MPLHPIKTIALPQHAPGGGFDHAAYHAATARLYVAHTSNDTLDWIDCREDRHAGTLSGLKGIAGALVSEQTGLVFTSNRGEDTVSVFPAGREGEAVKMPVGSRPNGLAFDPTRGILLAANVGASGQPSSWSLSLLDVNRHATVATIPTPGRTRWTIFDEDAACFYVNVGDPAQILVVNAETLAITGSFPIPHAGPHGLDFDPAKRRLFCACDSGDLVLVDLRTRETGRVGGLSGVPDVTFFNPKTKRLYVAVGNPGVVDVFDTRTLAKLGSVPTGKGAHTIGVDFDRNKIYAFLPETHAALVLEDRG